MERGSFSVEVTLVICLVLIVLAMILVRLEVVFDKVLTQTDEAERYEQAFHDKIAELLHEKVMKEKR